MRLNELKLVRFFFNIYFIYIYFYKLVRFLSLVILASNGVFQTKPSTRQIKNLEGDGDPAPLLGKDCNFRAVFPTMFWIK